MLDGSSISIVLSIGVIIFIAITIIKGIKVVKQSNAIVVERLGRYNRTLEGGFHILIPFLDNVREEVTKQEQLIDIPSQPVITKDNVNINVNGIVFIKVFNAKESTYGIVDFKYALSNLATTTLRSEIGQLTLDETLSSRDNLNTKVLEAIDEASNKWGIKTMRVEISDISVPQEIEKAMNLEMKAEREKRSIELKAEGEKQAVIREAEGIKAKTVLEAEAMERMADATKYEQLKISEGQKTAIENINQAMESNPDASNFLLAKDRISAFKALAENNSNDKVIIPYETQEFIGAMSVVKDMVGTNVATTAALS